MLLPVLLVVSFHLSCGQNQRKPGLSSAIDLTHYCATQHFTDTGTTKVSCNGSKHFKNKSLALDSRSIQGITDIELILFDNVNVTSKSTQLKSITIKNCKKVSLDVRTIESLNKLDIDSVDELVFDTYQSSNYSVNIQKILISNVGTLDLPKSSNARLKSDVFTLIKITDLNVYDQLKASGELLTISQSNVDISAHSMVALEFSSVLIKESTKLFVQENSQLDISTDFLLLQESYIYIDGKINVVGSKFLGNRKIIKVINNSIYSMKKNTLNIFGDNNKVNFTGKGIYRSDIGDIVTVMVEIKGVTFTNNRFGCNNCANKQSFQAKYRQDIGEENFCDLSCNLTLSRYKALLDKELICDKGVYEDDHDLCLSDSDAITNIRSDFQYSWILIPVICVSIFCISTVLYFYCRRTAPSFISLPVDNTDINTGAIPSELLSTNNQQNQQFVSRSYNNEMYAHVENNPEDNLYEIVD
ncbi:uncharacterized protein LOC128981945 isoform X1 [Macrosteles quadrilineatus]|uniref:uncharacterized protein LOC128981945 isoform X1 n=1 Tax=Macrosteles quadrilineatus TaxID=74068 RepID=UPI0023E1FC42|nr:uncharacterized protein LOC128981945 isoform X1 [Macrosteles quadrilineatus]